MGAPVLVCALLIAFQFAFIQTAEEPFPWKPLGSDQSKEFALMSTPVTWFEAVETCQRNMGELLCYHNRSEIRALLDSTLKSWGKIKIWMGRRDCDSTFERWLHLSITGHNTKDEQWEFSFSREEKLWFICKKSISTTTVEPARPTVSISTSVRCPETKRRNLLWPSTAGNTTVRLQCPRGKTGYAYWFCDILTGYWTPPHPDLSDCRSANMTTALQNIGIPDIVQTTSDLHHLIQSLKYGGEVTTAVRILDHVPQVFRAQAPTMTAAEKKASVNQASLDIIATCDKLIEVTEAWEDIPKEKRTDTATQLLSAVDDTGFLIASNFNDVKRTIAKDNIILEVSRPGKGSSSTRQATFYPDIGQNKTGGSVVLPLPLNNLLGNQTETTVVFAWFSNLGSILPSDYNHEPDSNRIVNSAVVSANISGGGFKGKLTNGQVIITLQHFEQGRNAKCAFWDTKLRLWNDEGCKLLESNETHTSCSCNHLTNFAILMDIHCVTCDLPSSHKTALSIITLTGCLISVFCLTVSIIIFTYYRSVWGTRTTIHRNLCISLWLGQVILLLGLEQTGNKALCSAVAIVLHYFFLCAFFWMLLEAVHIMVLLVKVFTPKRKHVIQHYVVGYGLSAIIVIITAAVKFEDYGTDNYCWISTTSKTIWSFLGPVVVILAFNLITLCKALWTMHQIMKAKEKLLVEGLTMWIRGATVLLPLLGLTWLIGFLYIDSNSLFMAYIFGILNSLQGFGIFIFHVVLNKKIKEVVSRSFERSSISRSGTTRTTTKSTSSVRSWPSFPKSRKVNLQSVHPNDSEIPGPPDDDALELKPESLQPKVVIHAGNTHNTDSDESDPKEDDKLNGEKEVEIPEVKIEDMDESQPLNVKSEPKM